MDDVLLIFWIRAARRKARNAAVVEVLRLLRDLEVTALPGGPFGDQKGVFWVLIPSSALEPARTRLHRLGYSSAVDALVPPGEGWPSASARRGVGGTVRWRGQDWDAVRIHQEDEDLHRSLAPDRRAFLIEKQPGVIEAVHGYRGSGGLLSRRGLPVCDARLLVNLVNVPEPGARFLDPFAGVGGLLIEARKAGFHVVSVDVDPILQHGLGALADEHQVSDARSLPFPDASFDALATEPPYHASATESVLESLGELDRVLRPGRSIAMLVAAHQAEALRLRAAGLRLVPFFDAPIDRKGTDVVLLAWDKPRLPSAPPGG